MCAVCEFWVKGNTHNPWMCCHGKCSVVYFKVQIALYSAGSGVNRVQVVVSGFSVSLLCFVQPKTLCRYGCMFIFAALVLVCVSDVRCVVHDLFWVVVNLKCKC